MTEFVVQDEEIKALLKNPEMEKLGMNRFSSKELRAMLEAEGGAWLVPADELMKMPEKELMSLVLLRGCAAAGRWRMHSAQKTAEEKKPLSALEVLKARKASAAGKAGDAPKTAADPGVKQGAAPVEKAGAGAKAQAKTAAVLLSGAQNTRAEVKFGEQKLSASVKLMPPGPGEGSFTQPEIDQLLAKEGVVFGLDAQVLERLVRFPVYDRFICVAWGRPPVDGVDGTIKYYFEDEPSMRLEATDDGDVNFKEMNYIKNVIQGDVLCEIFPPQPAQDGVDVTGSELPGYQGKTVTVLAGQNVELSEDGSRLIAAGDGQPMLKDGVVTVNDMLTLAKVDGTTGNITFFGSVTVQGDISSGFSVGAGGDILVKGFVENAQLSAGGNVVLQKGMNGGGIGMITAGLSVRSKFLEQVTVRAGKHVYGDVVLNCDIECEGRMILSGTKGCFSGGSCKVRNELQVSTLGNEAELDTRAEVRDEERIFDQLEMKQTRCAALQSASKRLASLTQHLLKSTADADSKNTGVVRAVFIRQRLDTEAFRLGNELEGLRRAVQREAAVGQIVVYNKLFPNVQMVLGGITFRNPMPRTTCVVRCREGEIVFETSLPPRRSDKED